MNNYSQEKNFQESETPNEHNYSQEIRTQPTKKYISGEENNSSGNNTTRNQPFIIEKEANTIQTHHRNIEAPTAIKKK